MNSLKLTMLGTGNAMVSHCYNTCFTISDGSEHLLVDAGGGNQIFRQLELAGIDRNSIHHIILTHKHTDHILGVIWMIRAIGQAMHSGKYEGDAYIYGNDEVMSILEQIAMAIVDGRQRRFIGDRIHLVTVLDGEERVLLGRKLTFFDIGSTKAKQYGFSMELPDGTRLTCCGDEPWNECELKYMDNCSWLLHEAFCLHSQADIFHPYEKHHSTVRDAASLAARFGIGHLVLYHTEDRNIADRKVLYMEEGREVYDGDLYVPDDLDVILLG